MNAVHFSSKSPVWETPAWLFNLLNEGFCFELDVCAEPGEIDTLFQKLKECGFTTENPRWDRRSTAIFFWSLDRPEADT